MSQLTEISPTEALDVESGLKFLPKSAARALAESPQRQEIVVECRRVIAAEHPASAEEFALIIERLWLHYPEHRLGEREQKLILQDWRRLMGDLPADLLRAAADAYLLSPARFAPTPGQLMATVRERWGYRLCLARRAKEILGLISEADALPAAESRGARSDYGAPS